jgi:hypothetical protein
MNPNQIIYRLCQIVALVYRSIGDYDCPSDGFCYECQRTRNPDHFRHSGITIRYILDAVKEKLVRDGHTLDAGVMKEIERVEIS